MFHWQRIVKESHESFNKWVSRKKETLENNLKSMHVKCHRRKSLTQSAVYINNKWF